MTRWTESPPTKPGMYWWRFNGTVYVARVSRTWNNGLGMEARSVCGSSLYVGNVLSFQGEWGGRVEPPSDSQGAA